MLHLKKIIYSIKETKDKYMNPDYAKLRNEDNFKIMSEMLALLTDYEMKKVENSDDDIVDKMPTLISLVNTLGFLRGQEGAFSGLRIGDENLRNLIRKNEIEYENRLGTLILNKIKGEGMRTRYKNKLIKFFVDFRCPSDSVN